MPDAASGVALIVEDNVIIAMETEDVLRGFGFEDCRVAGSVSSALAVIDEAPVAFAMLDVNLGKDTSEPVAGRLQELSIPFIFASGYGDSSMCAERFEGVPVVTKPYNERDIRSAIARVMRSRR